MIKQIVFVALASTLAAPVWAGEKSREPKQQVMGLGTGAVIGAAAGGPVGAILGAAFGGWLGDRFHHEKAGREESELRYAQALTDAERLEQSLNSSEQRLASTEDARQRDKQQFQQALEAALSAQVMFQTGDSSLDDESDRRLAEIAALIEPMDGVTVVLEGHADARGDAEYNEQLSAARAEAVKESLIRAGLGSNRISTHAEGERYAKAGEKDLDALALERRVVLSVVNLDSGNRVARH